MHLVKIDDDFFLNPQNVATLMKEGPETTRVIYADGRAQDRIELPIQKLADILNGEAMRYIITQDDDGDWWCDVPGESMQLGYGSTAEEAFADAKMKWEVRNNPDAIGEPLPEETPVPAEEQPTQPAI